MVNSRNDTDVLIVGAGPVGLLLANELARRGLRFRIIEAHGAQSAQSKALAIFPRTLEILDMAGLVGPFLENANRVASVAIVSRGRTLARLPFTPEASPYRFIAMVPQNVTERLLADRLGDRGAVVEYDASFVSAVEESDHVTATIERNGRRSTLRAAYVVGCDGSHSAVRHLLGLPFAGKEYDASFMLADIETNEGLAADELELCPDAAGPLAVFPMGENRARIVAIVKEREGEAPSLELVRRLLAERATPALEARELHWSGYFRVHHRHVAELGVGRFFIAGDAAHIHSPFGGQGMNTGMHDVWNLAWKLDFALGGRAGDALLDSYSAERLPVIKEVIETTHRLTRVMGTPSKLAQAARDVLIPQVTRLPSFRRAFVTRLSGLGIEYGASPIIDGSGKRCLDDSMRGGNGIGKRFLLLSDRDGDGATREELERFAASLGDLVELRFVARDDTVLVRPDGYIACTLHEGASAFARVRTLLDRQVRRPVAGEKGARIAWDLRPLRDAPHESARSAWS